MISRKVSKVIVSTIMIISLFVVSSIPVSATTLYGYGFALKPITIYASNSLSLMEVQQLQDAINTWNNARVGKVLVYGGKPLY